MLGFIPIRQKGSHLFFQHPDGRTTVVPRHGGEDMGRGILRHILREIDVSPDEFEKKYKNPPTFSRGIFYFCVLVTDY